MKPFNGQASGRQLIGKLPHSADDLLRTVLDLDNHRARFRRQGQALLGLQTAVGHQGHRVAGHVLVLTHRTRRSPRWPVLVRDANCRTSLGHYRKTSALLTGAGRFDGRVERQQVWSARQCR